ncbi:MAG: RecQ family ATP-dependent DNA helicase [Draconibacterium sp.]
MKTITFFDTEIDPKRQKILDIGSVKTDNAIFHSNSVSEFENFVNDSEYICGHNAIKHDLNFLQKASPFFRKEHFKTIDTLYLSPLLFPNRPYHKLLKDDKIQTDELNNPVNDSIKAKDLFLDEVQAFQNLNPTLQKIFYKLLFDKLEFKAFFQYLSFHWEGNLIVEIKQLFRYKICSNARLADLIEQYPVELAYCLALLNTNDRYSITPVWVTLNFPNVERLMFLLRNNPCITGCQYCNQALNAHLGLQKHFGFNDFRKYNNQPLQENAVQAAINNRSLLAIFPTGGGKSITFQIPALMAGENTRGLTVVISPLQSLMKDQVDNLEKNGITEAVTINGMLDPIERSLSFERVENGLASMLYISPESLRSKTIERLLLGRNIVRFVIDEAHCFSAWGQDFRVDYLYIADFIKQLQKKKNLSYQIPVSCFTATAKQEVINDIRTYLYKRLSLNLEIFRADTERENLKYSVLTCENEEEKYNRIRRLIDSNNCPTIIYVARTRKAFNLAQRLSEDGFSAKPYHGKMEIKEKAENQNAFINGQVQIMVATSAFGMGVDKKDVGLVIHYEISDSLENYVQEAGRAGRDENIEASCYVLFNEDDLSKHFILLNQTKLSIKEIQQIWRAIKEITRFRNSLSNSALEIARKAGWNDDVDDIETRVRTAIAALENSGYVKRGQNSPQIFATSILCKNAKEAIDKINASERFDKKQKTQAIRIIRNLISARSRKNAGDNNPESRVDYISDQLGIGKEKVIKIVNLLREEKVLADTKDLTAFIQQDDHINKSLAIVNNFAKAENFLLPLLGEREKTINLKELNEKALQLKIEDATPANLRTILNFWTIKNWIKQKKLDHSHTHYATILIQPTDKLKLLQEKRHELAGFIIRYLFMLSTNQNDSVENGAVEFSVHQLKEEYQKQLTLLKLDITIDDIEDTLFYLTRIGALKIEGGFLVIYNKLNIEKLEQNNKIQYKNEDYQQLSQFYQNKIQQVHIVGEYAKTMLQDYNKALKFVNDYFSLNYASFLNKYFPGSRKDEIKQNITPAKFRELFGTLSPRQLDIIKDCKNHQLVVAAGPGSGKTKVLVHKLASLLLMEDTKHEQLLMLTFSRAAATEFKKRLLSLIGNAANFVEIKTFHSYCFDLLGRVGNLEKVDHIIRHTVEKIQSGEVEQNRITKNVLVIDEAQDMTPEEFSLIKALMDRNEEMRLIAVGDDDQNIYTFRGADSLYFEQFLHEGSAEKYELVENYRSKKNLVHFSNLFIEQIHKRFKKFPIIPHQKDNGQIKIIEYSSPNLIVPLVNDILQTDLTGTTCILTKTNDEALQITGLLNNNGLPARLIQSNDGFNLFNLYEIRDFLNSINFFNNLPTIYKDDWDNAKREFAGKHKTSGNYELCKTLIKDFQKTHPKIKYKSDFEVFIRESKIEDFTIESTETITVSTIHKAKGKEFDNVYILLNNIDIQNDDKKRELYVAMTRAKQNLTIHTNRNYFRNSMVENLRYINNTSFYPEPEKLTLHLSHRDINLGYFKFVQHRLKNLNSGQSLLISEEGLLNSNRDLIVKFSKQFSEKKEGLVNDGFSLTKAKVNFILYWKPEDNDFEFIVVLPELLFEK